MNDRQKHLDQTNNIRSKLLSLIDAIELLGDLFIGVGIVCDFTA